MKRTAKELNQYHHKKSAAMDPITRVLLASILVIVPVLGYLILIPNSKAPSLQNTKDFAKFMESKPELANRETQRRLASAPDSRSASSTESAGRGLAEQDKNLSTALTSGEENQIQEYETAWNQSAFVQNQVWIDQVEELVRIADRSHNVAVLELFRKQIVIAKLSDDQTQRTRAFVWYEHYLKLESRPQIKNELIELFGGQPPN